MDLGADAERGAVKTQTVQAASAMRPVIYDGTLEEFTARFVQEAEGKPLPLVASVVWSLCGNVFHRAIALEATPPIPATDGERDTLIRQLREAALDPDTTYPGEDRHLCALLNRAADTLSTTYGEREATIERIIAICDEEQQAARIAAHEEKGAAQLAYRRGRGEAAQTIGMLARSLSTDSTSHLDREDRA